MNKVLIISYYWPPSGGIGVLRTLKFVKYLRKFGWEPIVVVPLNPDYPYYDYKNQKDIPKGLEILQIPIVEPFKIFKFITSRKNEPLNNIIHVRDKKSILDNLGIWIRGNFFIPDARCLWIKPSIKYLTNYLRNHKVDAILSDGPPHTNTVIATIVAKKFNLPFLADFQDPWTQVDYYKLFKIGKRADKKHRLLEQETFKTASKITIASPSWKNDLESIGAQNVDVIYYGYDEDDFSKINISIDSKFTICHSGLLGSDRNPTNLFQVIRELISENEEFKNNLKIKLLGQIDISVREAIDFFGLSEFVDLYGVVSREVSLVELCNSWVLILPLNKAENVNGRIPGKFFEYIRAKRPIISFGPNGTDVSKLILKHGIGINIEWNETMELKYYIQKQYENYKINNFFSVVYDEQTKFYSNENQTKLLAGFLNTIKK